MRVRTLMIVLGLGVIATGAYCQSGKRSHLSITPGVDFSTMRAQDRNGTHVDFPDGVNFRIGADFEFPVGSGKWAIMFEPTLQRYTAHRPYLLQYRSLEVPLGVRRYFAVNKKTGFFLNGAAVGDIPLLHSMQLLPNVFFKASKFKGNFAAGVGVAVSRFTIEYRHYTQRTRKDDTGSFTYNYNKRSIIVGFRLY